LHDLLGLLGKHVNFITRGRFLRRGQWSRQRCIGDVPLPEPDQGRNQQLPKAQHEVGFVWINLLNVDGRKREHEPQFVPRRRHWVCRRRLWHVRNAEAAGGEIVHLDTRP
jgi:hypothetical protein